MLVYSRDHHCRHNVEIPAARWADHVRLSDIEPGFVCTACGKRGADVRAEILERARVLLGADAAKREGSADQLA